MSWSSGYPLVKSTRSALLCEDLMIQFHWWVIQSLWTILWDVWQYSSAACVGRRAPASTAAGGLTSATDRATARVGFLAVGGGVSSSSSSRGAAVARRLILLTVERLLLLAERLVPSSAAERCRGVLLTYDV